MGKTATNKLTFWQLLTSVLAAMLGVQSEGNRQRDFSRGSAVHFIAIGTLVVIGFVLILYGLVSLILS